MTHKEDVLFYLVTPTDVEAHCWLLGHCECLQVLLNLALHPWLKSPSLRMPG